MYHIKLCFIIILRENYYKSRAAAAGGRSAVGVGKGCALCAWQHAVSPMNVAFPVLVTLTLGEHNQCLA